MNFMSINCRGLGNTSKLKWINDLCRSHLIKFLALQETKVSNVSLFQIRSMWGDIDFEIAETKPIGKSGGIVSIWDRKFFYKDNTFSDEGYVAFFGRWIPNGIA